MLKQQVITLIVGLAIILSLLGGVALSVGTTAAQAAPIHAHLACVVPLPPCI